ncbi:hypothetical protein Tco_1329197 [Tanacetum coccineum]
MVAYLEKTEGSEGFHQIIDFLIASHINYALTKSPTIYASLIEQFWQTAALSTIEDGVMEITAIIDERVKTISEASIRRHLKLEDSDGISTLPTAEIFEQLEHMGYVTTSDSLTFQKGHFSPQWKFLIHTIIYCLSLKKTAWEQFSSNIATAIICMATNRTFNFSNLIFEAMIEEIDLDAGILLVPLHVADQGRFDDTQVSDQPEEQLGVFSTAKVLAVAAEQRRDVENVQTYTRRRRAVSTGSGGVSTASELVSTAGVKAKDKGKTVMQESEPPKKIKKKVQVQMSIDEELAQKVHEEEQAKFNVEQEVKFKAKQEQERLDHETAMKIQEELDAAERQRMAQMHQASQGFTDDEWVDILARVAADKDFVQQLQAGEKVSDEDLPRKLVELVNQRKKFFAQQRDEAKRNKPMTHTQQKEYIFYEKGEEPKEEELSQEQLHQMMMVIPVEEVYVEALQGHTEAYQTFDDMLKKFDRDDLDKLWNLVKERFKTTEPAEDKARELWDYPLTKALATLMLCNKLRVDQYSDMADELLQKINIIANRPRQSRPMDLESTENNTLAKLPLLKQGDYDTWRLRIESYIQLQEYALWEIIEDGNSFKPVARTTTNADGTSTSTIPGAFTAKEKIQKKNDVKA